MLVGNSNNDKKKSSFYHCLLGSFVLELTKTEEHVNECLSKKIGDDANHCNACKRFFY